MNKRKMVITRDNLVKCISLTYPELKMLIINNIVDTMFKEVAYNSTVTYVHRYNKDIEYQKEFALDLFCTIYMHTSLCEYSIDNVFAMFRLTLMNSIKHEEKLKTTLTEQHYNKFLEYCEIPDF